MDETGTKTKSVGGLTTVLHEVEPLVQNGTGNHHLKWWRMSYVINRGELYVYTRNELEGIF